MASIDVFSEMKQIELDEFNAAYEAYKNDNAPDGKTNAGIKTSAELISSIEEVEFDDTEIDTEIDKLLDLVK